MFVYVGVRLGVPVELEGGPTEIQIELLYALIYGLGSGKLGSTGVRHLGAMKVLGGPYAKPIACHIWSWLGIPCNFVQSMYQGP